MHKVPSKVKKITVSTLTSTGVIRPSPNSFLLANQQGANGSADEDRELDELVPRGGQPTVMYTDADVGTGGPGHPVPRSAHHHHRFTANSSSPSPIKSSNQCSRCSRLNIVHLLVNASLALIVFAIGIMESAKCPTTNHKLPHLMITYGSLWFLKTLLDVLVKYEVKSDPILFKFTYDKICYPIEMTMAIMFVARKFPSLS